MQHISNVFNVIFRILNTLKFVLFLMVCFVLFFCLFVCFPFLELFAYMSKLKCEYHGNLSTERILSEQWL